VSNQGSGAVCKRGAIGLLVAASILATFLVQLRAATATLAAQADSADTGPDLPDHEAIRRDAQAVWVGDLDGMLERKMVRLLTVSSLPFYFLDGVHQKGVTYELSREFEKYLRSHYGAEGGGVQVVVMPMRRDRLFAALVEGRGDLIAANLTVTDERRAKAAFGDPFLGGVREVLVTGPAAGQVATFDALVETPVYVRKSSSFYEHLGRLNDERTKAGKKPVRIEAADEALETEDILELVNDGVMPATVIDEHLADFWSKLLPDLTIHRELVINTDGQIAWAMRPDSPKLLAAVNGFVKTAKKGTLLGNLLLKRYGQNTKWVQSVRSPQARERFRATVDFIKQYAGKYDFDWLMIAAQGYQESGLDQSKRSATGAVGVMQVLPTTAADPNVGIPSIDRIDNNVHAGVKYLRFLRDRYFDDPGIDPIDRALFSFAAYNAGPGNIAKARKAAAAMGYDPDRWFDNVEIAAAKKISREPVVYVRNIYKYYVSYSLLAEYAADRNAARKREADAAGTGAR